jgi:uncharacterized protein (TIGR04255 family)
MRPFVTPLFEVSTEANLGLQTVVDFRARSFYASIESRCPIVQQFPVFIVPPEQATPEQLQATPPVYRFSSDGDAYSVAIGPRMFAANVRRWPGYGSYRDFVELVAARYLELSYEPTVQHHSVGFYNRIPVASIDELREVVDAPFDFRGDVTLYELFSQSAKKTEVGSLLTQMFVMAPGPGLNEPHLVINNIIRSSDASGQSKDPSRLLAWLDAAHEIAREALWGTLSEQARNSWKRAD